MSLDLSTLVTIGKQAFEEKDFFRAERVLREAIGSGASYADLYYILGLIYHQWGKLHRAVEYFEKAIGLNPAYTEALLSLSITYNDMGRYEEAKDAYQRASQSVSRAGDPTRGGLFRGKIANLHAELGELYRALGQTEDAIQEYRKALKAAPEYPDLRVRMAVALREAGRMEEGLEETERILAIRQDNVPARIQQGILLYLTGKKRAARSAWEDALFRDPTNKLVQLYLNTLDRETTGK
ncbi:MAG TPA: tetratricopeptide repeat protein [Candidatus Limnocylindrales bacterium]|nr:tetratricopeptide repeat protein [Candidatus Limnocylindrales bacterium]